MIGARDIKTISQTSFTTNFANFVVKAYASIRKTVVHHSRYYNLWSTNSIDSALSPSGNKKAEI